MGVIMGLTKKQDAILSAVLEQDVAVRNALEALSPVASMVGGVSAAEKVVGVLMEISRSTLGDAFDISEVLSLNAASRHGDVLSASPIRVEVDDALRRDWDDIRVEEGLLLCQGRSLVLYLKTAREAYPLMSEEVCKMWGTTPVALAAWIDTVYLYIGSDGTPETRIYCGGRELDDSDTVEEFAGVPGEVS